MSPSPPELLIVGAAEKDDAGWRPILEHYPGNVHHVPDCRGARSFLGRRPVSVVVCERDLPDGSWRDVLHSSASLADPPAVIIASRLADERLWLDVLQAGGYDVLTKPFNRNEVARILALAAAQAPALRRSAGSGFIV
jgi:DNA-binding response OmpR family regulator